MPLNLGARRRTSFQTSSAVSKLQSWPMRCAMSRRIITSSRASPGGSTALRTRCTRRSLLMTVPSVSAQLAAAGKHHVGHPGRLGHEDVLHHQEVQAPEELLVLVLVGVGLHRVLPDDVHAPDLAVGHGVHHLGLVLADLLRQRSAPYLLEERVRLGVVPAPAADLLVRQGAHVAAALHVVLAAQRVEARSVLADVAGQEPKRDEREHPVGAVVVLGDAERPVQRSLIRRGVHAGHLADVLGRDARDLLGVLRRVAGDLLPVRLEVFRGPLDELLVVEVFLDDDVAHRVSQADVGADVEAEPLVGLLDLVYLARVYDDHLRAVLYAAAHVVVDDGVALHGVGAPADYYVGVLELLVRGGRPARSKRCHQTGDAGGVSSAVT